MVRQDLDTVGTCTTLQPNDAADGCERATPSHGSREPRFRPALLPPVWLASSFVLAAGLAPPAFAQNAASIPAVVTVVQSPFASARTDGASRWAPGSGSRSVPPLGERVFLLAGLASLVTEGVEPAVVRVRLEYVGN